MTTTWADLFERAETIDADLETIRETLEVQRDGDGSDDPEPHPAGDEVSEDE
ncbi:hypothetical protein [Halostagnicola kamekurae]|uniref:Uncharacterized protein n=1 Tax=Halostagnicola kamekurae TaxID=619731 RepID=A0A1I6PLC3_9EURY|nr:hypothetical protein [Halostagnicola kamekurae]SFS41013.1 hypothetical protein SAMN04488556_0643 [Halostagnicola kamekurae]